VAEWLRNGLQNRVHQFNSGRGLHPNPLKNLKILIRDLFRKIGLLPLCYHSQYHCDLLGLIGAAEGFAFLNNDRAIVTSVAGVDRPAVRFNPTV
jgi:hypothetical protein